MFNLKAIAALMTLASIVGAAPADVAERADDTKSCYCGSQVWDKFYQRWAQSSNPDATVAACGDFGAIVGAQPKCHIIIDFNEGLFINKCKAIGQPIGWCENHP
ncbi:hypothetical protein C8035_v009301 [Colletotrichum spinosum]|uniref:Uncharacterized protein n=1 Tax=Colletotrichum spinosum TaxID=1347390 RepID=A0A4R8Q9S4_9PEZI|nr:hypothetical protein C8035_v009301 [Colletotrichum spinosum]